MKKFIVSLFAALALFIGYNVAPADAHVMAPYSTVQDQVGTCSVFSTYGTYGLGYAQITIAPFASGCHGYTGVMVSTLDSNNVIHEQWCYYLWTALTGNSSPGCTLDGNRLLASAPGGAFGMRVYVCYGSAPSCALAYHSAF